LTQIGQRFGLSHKAGDGVFCSEDGLFVGDVPLLKRIPGTSGASRWLARPVRELNRDLSSRYGLPIELDAKMGRLSAIARALERRDLIHARIATLHLRFPDPPSLAKSKQTTSEIFDLAHRLRASGLLKADWNPAKHPRWPAGSPDSVGGRFAPKGSDASGFASTDSTAQVIPVQGLTTTAPLDFALPRTIPWPSEIAPASPWYNPREGLRNPYPDRPECEQEWAEAIQYCGKLKMKGLLGTDGYRGMGRTFRSCVMANVSAACGGDSTA
jgi:hypothetical protein